MKEAAFTLGGIACALLVTLSADRGFELPMRSLITPSLISLLPPTIETFSYVQEGGRTEGVAFLPGIATLVSAVIHRTLTAKTARF